MGFEKSRNELACFMGREDSSSLNCLEILLYFPSQDFILANLCELWNWAHLPTNLHYGVSGESQRGALRTFNKYIFIQIINVKREWKLWNENFSATYDNHLLRLASFNAHFTLLWEQKLVVTEEVFSLKVLSVWKFHSYCQRKYQTELENETKEKRRKAAIVDRLVRNQGNEKK